jgi:hypothetical protein
LTFKNGNALQEDWLITSAHGVKDESRSGDAHTPELDFQPLMVTNEPAAAAAIERQWCSENADPTPFIMHS